MGFSKTYCANVNCPKHTVYTGGRFIYSKEKRAFYCEDCFHPEVIMNGAKNLWDFTTTHFNGHPIHVQGLSHLRELEKQYGCSSHAANHMQADWNTPPARRAS